MVEVVTSINTLHSASVELTDRAAKRIAVLVAKEPGSSLRITVEGGGCSGFKYHYDFAVHTIEKDDLVLEKADIHVLIDAMSLEFLKGCTIDYIETLGSAGFEIINPNASAKCGCGNSFAM